MANEHLLKEFIPKINSAITRAKTIPIAHPGTRGRLRELLVEEFLKPILPSGVDITTGHVTDCYGNVSKQLDVIIYSDAILPSVLRASEQSIVPVEACLYTIEVKSVASRREVQDAIAKADSVKCLSMEPGLYGFPNVNRSPAYLFEGRAPVYQAETTLIGGKSPPFVFFAFSSDLREKSELERYIEIVGCDEKDDDGQNSPSIAAMCVIGSGYWHWNDDRKSWVPHSATDEHDELLELLCGISNTIPTIVLSRGRPRFGRYLMRR